MNFLLETQVCADFPVRINSCLFCITVQVSITLFSAGIILPSPVFIHVRWDTHISITIT